MAFIFQILAVLGIFALCYTLVVRHFGQTFHQSFGGRSLHPIHVTLFIVSVAWCLSVGLRGVMGLWGYALNQPVGNILILNGLVGFAGILLSLFYFQEMKPHFRFPVFQLRFNEKLVLGMILIAVGVYAYCALVPWQETDEILVYGVDGKNYALGLTFSEQMKYVTNNFRIGSKLGEMLTAQSLFAVGGETYLGRALRLLNILFVCLGSFSFLRFLGVKRFWALIGAASILLLFDVQRVAVYFKVDNVLMIFEFCAVMLFTLALLSYFPDHHLLKQKRHSLMMLAVAFCALALATRLSALYLCFLVTLVALAAGLSGKMSRTAKTAYSFSIVGILVVCSVLYLRNIYDFGNPLFPFDPPWPFREGLSMQSMSDWKNRHNLNLFPPIFNQLYLLFHMALGVSTIGPKLGLDFLPGSAFSQSLRWTTPVMLSILAVPFFWRRSPVVKILSLLFLYWFALWSVGLHFTRVFIAGICIPILLAVIIASLNKNSLTSFQNRLRKSVQILLVASLGVFFLHLFRDAANYSHNWHTLFGKRARYEAKLNRFNGTTPFTGPIIKPLPTFEEARQISEHLSKFPLPVIHADYSRGMHIYFDRGVFIPAAIPMSKEEIQFFKSPGKFDKTALYEPDGDFRFLRRADCYLDYHQAPSKTENEEAMIHEFFPDNLFDNGAFALRCRQRKEELARLGSH